MQWLWAIAPLVLVLGASAVAVASRRLAEEASALVRAGEAWQAVRADVDETVTAVMALRRSAGALGRPPERTEGHP